MAQTSGVLIVGPQGSVLGDLGAMSVADFSEARAVLSQQHPSVLVFKAANKTQLDEFCREALKLSPDSVWLIAAGGLPPSQVIHWNNFGRLIGVFDDFDDPALETMLKSAVETAGLERQRRELAGMFEEQSSRLKRLSSELEARVDKRHKTLRKSLRTLNETKSRLESFHKALLGIHRASTVLQMEQTLNEALHAAMDMAWVRVRFANQSLLSRQSGPGLLSIEIPFRDGDSKMRGEVVFCKAGEKKFSSGETDFLHELSEALALAMTRLYKLEQAEVLKAQWQATFDSIPHALALTTADFEILKLNRAFQQACEPQSFRGLIGKNCYQVFFGGEFQPPSKMESPFTFRNSRTRPGGTEHYEVVGETLGIPVDNQRVQLILLRSITGEVRYERRILEASKLAELGTIGSSIAHELNNPLGGMLSFLQLILMELPPGAPHHGEIKEMEMAVLRCRDIVQNLLSFARKQDPGEFAPVDLNDVVDRAAKLIELQSKSKGIAVEFERGPAARINGNINALSQALCNILQNSIDAIVEKMKADPLFAGRIQILLDSQKGRHELRVSDNGTGIRPEYQSQIFNPLFTTRDPGTFAGMGLTLAFTIVSDHRGTLEILSQTGSGTTAILAFPRLDVPPEKPGF
jgi:signal transduction histidine kinase